MSFMNNANDLRHILSSNIKKARSALHITQTKLAQHSDISAAHIIEIEQCKTWVSDRTLTNIARALNMDAYELLLPEHNGKYTAGERYNLQQTAEIIQAKKAQLRKSAEEVMDDLILEIIRL